MDYSPPGSSVHGILQTRIMEWAAISISRGSSQPRDRTRFSGISCNGRWIFFFFYYYWEASKAQSISIFQQRILRSLQILIPWPRRLTDPNLPFSLFPLPHTIWGCLRPRHWRYSASSSVSPSQLSLKISRVTWNLGLFPLLPLVFSSLVTASSRALGLFKNTAPGPDLWATLTLLHWNKDSSLFQNPIQISLVPHTLL